MTAIIGKPQRPARPARQRWRPSIAVALTVGLILGVSAAMGAALWVGLGTAQRNTEELLRWQAQAIVQALRLQVEQYLSAAVSFDQSVATRLGSGEIAADDGEALSDLLRYGQASAPQLIGAAFVEPDGTLTGNGGSMGDVMVVRQNWSHRASIAALLQASKEHGAEPWFWIDWIDDLKITAISAAMNISHEGKLLGSVVSLVSIQALSDFLSKLDATESFTAFILFGPDNVLAHPSLAGGPRGGSAAKPLPTLGEVNDPVLANLWTVDGEELAELLAGTEIQGRLVTVAGTQQVVLWLAIEGYGEKPIYVGAHFPIAEAGNALGRLQQAAIVAGGVLLVTLIGLIIVTRRVSRPVQGLAAAARAVETLDFENAPQVKRGPFRETAAAADAFNAMLKGLSGFNTYVPRSLVRRVLQSGEARSELREVTVLFTDVVGFTTMSQKLSAGHMAGFLNRHFALLGECIEATGGTVDKYIGDSIMAFWGAPEPQADHRHRALAAAVLIARALARDNARRRRKGLKPIRVRIGLASGPAIVGNVGAPGRINYTLIGDTVNTAQRLEILGRTYLSPKDDCVILTTADTVAELTPDLGSAEALGEVELTGRSGATPVARVRPKPEDAPPQATPG